MGSLLVLQERYMCLMGIWPIPYRVLVDFYEGAFRNSTEPAGNFQQLLPSQRRPAVPTLAKSPPPSMVNAFHPKKFVLVNGYLSLDEFLPAYSEVLRQLDAHSFLEA